MGRFRRAFTLVEILIVVVILGILAGIVVPQFTNATNEARGGNLEAQLATLQNQIELYRAQNNGAYPDFGAGGWDNLLTNEYIKETPRNPAYTGSGTKDSVAVVTGTSAGSATAAWVWNSDSQFLYASNFDEGADPAVVTTNPGD